MSQVSHYLDALAGEIGPRPVASDTERRGAEWLQEQFSTAGLSVELQDFDTTRSPSTAGIITYFLLVLSLLALKPELLGPYFVLRWACWFVVAALGVLTVLDTFGRRGPLGLKAMLPKGPSQNVIARSFPHTTNPGDQPTKVVLLANYDSALSSLLGSETRAWLYQPLQRIAGAVAMLMPLLSLLILINIKAFANWTTWIWYVLLALCLPGVVLLFNDLLARLFKRYSPGANNNASGIAALLSATEILTAGRASSSGTTMNAPITGVAGSSSTSAFADIAPETGEVPLHAASPAPRESRLLNFETVEFGSLSDEVQSEVTSSYASLDNYDAQSTFAPAAVPAISTDVLDTDVIGTPSGPQDFNLSRTQRKKSGPGFFKRLRKDKQVGEDGFPPARELSAGEKTRRNKKKKSASHVDDPSNWLGVDQGFDARQEGKAIGSWDNFGEGNDDDGFAWKGGFAGDDPIEDESYAASEAARIRRRIAESLDVDLAEKELWFVATGAHYAQRAGIRAFLNDYSEQTRNALFINLSSLGAGDLYWTVKERFAGKNYTSAARLTSLARRLSRELDIRAKALRTRGATTDAGPILAKGGRAVSLLRLTEKGVPFACASEQDTPARIDSANIDEAVEFICELVRKS